MLVSTLVAVGVPAAFTVPDNTYWENETRIRKEIIKTDSTFLIDLLLNKCIINPSIKNNELISICYFTL